MKELISFDQTKFPLQSALVDQMLEVRSPNKDGEIIWPDQVVEDAEEKEVNDEERDKIDIQYRDIFGSYPPDDWTFDQKYEKVALELFGDIDDDDSWETVETLAIEDDDNHPGSDDEPPAIEDTGDTGSGDDDLKDAEFEGSHEVEADQPRVPRGRKIHLPKKITFSTSPATCVSRDADIMKKDKGYANFIKETAAIACPAARRKITQMADRRIVEHCCGGQSLIGRSKYMDLGCAVFRMTIHHDLITEAGLKAALRAVRGAGEKEYVHLWASLPCTAGSPWQRINKKHLGLESEWMIS